MNYKKHSLSLTKIIIGLLALMPLSANALDTENRWQVRDFYNNVYFYGSDADISWTGSYSPANAGSVSQEWLDATLVRINFFREMAGIPADVVFDPVLNAKSQESAMIQSVQGYLSHFPPQNGIFWTQDGYDAAGAGNIAIGTSGADAITGFMVDPGASNAIVGHRRWFLYPQTKTMGSGCVPGEGPYAPANTVWVQDEEHIWDPTPWNDIRNADGSITWPPQGYVPSDLVWGRWSLTYPNANFTNASVTMTMGASNVPLVLEPYTFSTGLPVSTLVWVPNGMDTNSDESWPTPTGTSSDDITVTVSNVTGSGIPSSFTYTVKIFNAGEPGPSEYETELSRNDPVPTNVPVAFDATTRPGWSEGIEGRIFRSEAYTSVIDAEAATNPFEETITGPYDSLQTEKVASGSKSFMLVHHGSVSFTTQYLAMPDLFIVDSANAELSFDSCIYSGLGQIAAVEINSGGSNWDRVWSKQGPASETSFSSVSPIDLSAYLGKVIQIRFVYEYVSGQPAFPYPQPLFVGWAFDNITLTGLLKVTGIENIAQVSGSTISPVFTSMDTVHLQAREYGFGGFPLNWGPLLEVTPSGEGSYEIVTGEWSDDPIFGLVYGFSSDWAYSPVMGWFSYAEFPWIYSPVLGWMKHVHGDMVNGLWLYSNTAGFIYTREDLGTAYSAAPFDSGSWGTFQP